MDQKTSIGDHPALRPSWQQPALGVLFGLEAVCFVYCAIFGHWPVFIGAPQTVPSRIVCTVMAPVLVWMSYDFFLSNRRTRQLRERLVAQEARE